MTLLDAQLRFPPLLAKLLTYATDAGVRVTMGECWRSRQQAQLNLAAGVGIANSLHCDRLAVDLLCWRLHLGQWEWLQQGTEPEYTLLGQYWKRLAPDCAWGGDFTKKPDPGHFSLAYGGRR